jgi:arginase
MLNRRIGLIGIPYNVGSRGKCLQKGAEALRKAGIVEALRRVRKITDFGNICVSLPPPDYRNPSLLNPNQVETLCRAVAERIKIVLEADCLPFIIGGDCSVLMGIVQGLKGLAPRLGIVYMDAHGDFNTPETTPSGTIGGMDVAIVAARGPKVLTEMFGHAPLAR